MEPSLLVGVELPPVVALRTVRRTGLAAGATWGAAPGAGCTFEWWRTAARAACRAGVTAVWCSGGAGSDAEPTCDPVVLGSATLLTTVPALIGVVSCLPSGRHPAVLAREVTALDVVSRGRAAVLLRFEQSATGGGAGVRPHLATGADAGGVIGAGAGGVIGAGASGVTVAEYLAEAAEICRAVLTEDAAAFEGRYLHVAGAVNRPAPVRSGGPPVLVEVPEDWPAIVEESAAGRQSGGRLVAAATALVCRGGRDRLAACRRAMDGLSAQGVVAAAARRAGLLHVAATGDHQPRAAGGTGRDGGEVASWRDAGAEGVILQLDPGSAPAARADPSAEEDRLAAVLGWAVERWSR